MDTTIIKYKHVGKIASELGVTTEQIDQLMTKLTSSELYKCQRSSLGNPEILLGFLFFRISKIEEPIRSQILSDVVNGVYKVEVLKKMNSKSYSTYEILLEESGTV